MGNASIRYPPLSGGGEFHYGFLNFNKLTKALLALAIVSLGFFILANESEESDADDSGQCGYTANWSYSDGILSISGYGKMADYSKASEQPWYSYRDLIREISIDDDIESIGKYAFANLSALNRLTYSDCETDQSGNIISSQLSSISAYAFQNTPIAAIPLYTSNLANIYDGAFSGCTCLSAVEIGDGLEDLGPNTFKGCMNLQSVVIGSNCFSIGDSAFENCVRLESATIKSAKDYIGANAFRGCGLLKSLFLPDNLKVIRSSAFQDCVKLNAVTVPDNVTTIGDNAFYGCTSLTILTIGESVKSLGIKAFGGCTHLTEIYFNAEDALGMASRTDHKTMSNGVFTGCGTKTAGISVVFGESVISVPTYLFVGYTYYNYGIFDESSPETGPNVVSVTLPVGLQTIGYKAFAYLSGLQAVSIPGTVISIGDSAFESCTALQSLVIPDSVVAIGQYAFYGCTSIATLTVGKGVESLGTRVFAGCTQLAKIHFNSTDVPGMASWTDGGYTLSKGVFTGCGTKTAGISVTFGESVASVPVNLFVGYTNYGYYNGWKESSPEAGPNVVSVALHDGIQTIGYRSFAYLLDLQALSIPKSVVSIDSKAFSGLEFFIEDESLAHTAENLAGKIFCGTDGKLYLTPPLVGTAFSSNGIDYIVTSVDPAEVKIMGCAEGTTVLSVPKEVSFRLVDFSVASVGDKAFYGSKSLAYVDLGGVRSVGTKAFANCTGLKTLDMLSVSEIAPYAFFGCPGLRSVEFSKNLESVGKYAFNSVKFYDGDALLSKVGDLRGHSFSGEDGNLGLSVAPVGTKISSGGISYTITSSYPLEAAVTGFSGSVLVVPDYVVCNGRHAVVTSVGSQAFLGAKKLASVDLGPVKEIGFKAFANCALLKEVSMESVESVGRYAFYGSNALETVSFSDSLQSVASSSFSVKFYDGGKPLAKDAGSLRGKTFEGSAGSLYVGPAVSVGMVLCESGLEYTVTSVEPLAASLTGHEGEVRRLFVPDAVCYKGLEIPVVSVGAKAFMGCAELVSADLGSVETVGSKAFANCSALESVRMASVSSVGSYAFYLCESIDILDLGSVTEIGSYAFRGLAGLVFVEFSDGLSVMGSYVFHSVKFYCDGMEVQRTADGLRGHSFAKVDGVLVWA